MPNGDGAWLAGDDDAHPVGLAMLDGVPQLIPGVEQLGEYQGSGLTGATYLVRNPRGQVVQVSRLLNLVLTGIDGRSTAGQIAARVTADFGRPVSAGNVEYLLAHKLAPLGLLAAGDGAGQEETGPDPAVLVLKLRRTLVPEAGVQFLARLFRPLFYPAVVVAALAALTGSDIWLLRRGQLIPALEYVLLRPPLLLLVLGLSVLSMLFHECGHAAACRYGGARPGVIGVGFYVVWPAFFTNVTDTYRLGRAGRIRTDLGGVYFNAVFVLAMVAAYRATGYLPLLPAIILVHLELVQQLLPSLRLDGYFILADAIGVPDLFRRIGPTLRSLIPGRADPRVQGLKPATRVILTAWVLLVVPLLGFELAFIILEGPSLVRTFDRSLAAQGHDLLAQLGRADVAAGLVSAISLVLLVLPMAGLAYILLLTGRRALLALVSVNRRHPVLRVPSVAAGLALAAVLAAQWGLLPAVSGHADASRLAAAAPRNAAAAPALPRPMAGAAPVAPVALQRQAPPLAALRPVRRVRRVWPVRHAGRVTVLTPIGAQGFDPLGDDPSDQNNYLAGYAIDQDPQTAWQTQYYLGNPVFGGLKTGSGLILDMGQAVGLRSITITFGPAPGADVAIEVGNDDTPAPATLATFTTVASADDVGGSYTFHSDRAVRGRYVLIWFTKLPPAGGSRFQAQIFNVAIRGTVTTNRDNT